MFVCVSLLMSAQPRFCVPTNSGDVVCSLPLRLPLFAFVFVVVFVTLVIICLLCPRCGDYSCRRTIGEQFILVSLYRFSSKLVCIRVTIDLLGFYLFTVADSPEPLIFLHLYEFFNQLVDSVIGII